MITTDCTQRALLLGVSLVLIIGQTLFSPALAQDKTPPPLKEPSMAKPVATPPVKSEATFAEGVQHGYSVDIAGKALTGSLDIKGRVTAIDTGRIAFTTEKGEPGHLSYRLPEGLALKLNLNDVISLTRKTVGRDISLGYSITLTVDKGLALASGRTLGDTPKMVTILPGLALRQLPDRTKPGVQGKNETTYDTPLILTSDSQTKRLSQGEPVEFTFNGQTYLVAIRESRETVPTREKEGAAEGQGFSLEYAIVLK